jgi:plasmid stabilization system protein ParE
MSVRKADVFLADVEHQAERYLNKAGWEVADRYLAAVEATCRIIGQYPGLGPKGRFHHPRLRDWRFFLVFRPYSKHILFYEVIGSDVECGGLCTGIVTCPAACSKSPGQINIPTAQYLGTEGSISSAQARMPPLTLLRLLKPC